MKFALITPAVGARLLYASRLSYHMALAQYLISDPNYLAAYAGVRRTDNGAFIIVDNGEAEGNRQSFDNVVNIANQIRADEIVMPDVIRDWKQTIETTTDPAAQALVPPRQRFVVPQGTNLKEWGDCLHGIIDGLEGQFRTIGVPKHLISSAEQSRAPYLEYLEIYCFHKNWDVHLLGANSPGEIADLNTRFPWVRGIDTAMPIGWAQEHLPIHLNPVVNKSVQWGKPFDMELARENVAKLLTYCQ